MAEEVCRAIKADNPIPSPTELAEQRAAQESSPREEREAAMKARYEKEFENKGMIFSGLSPDNKLPEIIELKDHPWFIGVQFHPEFKSRPLTPHPLFSSFIKAADINLRKN